MPPKKKPASPAKPAVKKSSAPKLATPLSTVKHKDKRVNIPTEELRDFVADDEKKPKRVLYPRDPSLDPQLVWKGKDEQDSQPLEVPAVPIYIQEKIHPQAIIENLRDRRGLEDRAGLGQIPLFSDFNGIGFEDLIDFYKHQQNWANRMILGDSLLVMTSLAEKEGLRGKVQMIYFDPPYGIKFGSNWQVSTRKRDVKDGRAEDATRQPEQIKAFRDTWQLGIHSYLAYLRDRLTAARELLTESGSIFVQIGDENVHLVRNVLDEVFGSENFISQIAFATTTGRGARLLDNNYDILLWYAKHAEMAKYREILRPKGQREAYFAYMQTPDGVDLQLSKSQLLGEESNPEGRRFLSDNLTSQGETDTGSKPFDYNGSHYECPVGRHWRVNVEGLRRLGTAGRLFPYGRQLRAKTFLDDYPVSTIGNIWDDVLMGSFVSEKIYVVQTSDRVIERCMLMTTDPGDLVLDPTCGSGTTAYVAEQWGRRWITLDTSRVAIALARTRLMAGRFPYYLLADSAEGAKKEMEVSGDLRGLEDRAGLATTGDIKRGFVYKRVPHITLKSIANNEDIDAIHARYQEQLEPLRAKINQLAKQKWEEWQVPREAPKDLSGLRQPSGAQSTGQDLTGLLSEWWRLRRERQKEIDASIAKRADTELLYDQPYEDNKRIRVTGPFTVESLSPHRVLPTDDGVGGSQTRPNDDATSFAQTILDNLKKAGVQNMIKNERLKFDSLEPYAGVWLQASGTYTERPAAKAATTDVVTTSVVKRVAISIGPEYGTVGPEQVKESAKEAVQGVGFDLLVVCGFAFDPHVSEEAKRYGKLTVLTARMNPDLAMGEELLKKTGAGNLFMVFGEPDVDVKRVGATHESPARVTVTVRGVDVYDPTTGSVRSGSVDDIACWFLDTNYNGESFFVRHAYFTGADEPYEKLKRALRAGVDEAAWSALYSTQSLPFDPPQTGKIAVKVINHYGDEVMKVYPI